MRSFGLYYSKLGNQSNCDLIKCPILTSYKKHIERKRGVDSDKKEIVEVHCNLWKVVEKKNLLYRVFRNSPYKYYLDFGLMFSPNISKLILHLPFEFIEANFSDLGKKLNQQELCSLIFNENVQISSSAGTYHIIEFPGKKIFVYPLSKQNLDFEQTEEMNEKKQKYKGTNIIIKLNSLPPIVGACLPERNNSTDKKEVNSTPRIYLRFRLQLSSQHLENIRKEEFMSTDILQSIFSRIEMFDFRINDDREIDGKIDEELKSRNFVPFRMNKVHFLFMSDTRNTIVNSSFPSVTRFLETEKWGEYIDVLIPQSMLAHHWKDKKERILKLESDSLCRQISPGNNTVEDSKAPMTSEVISLFSGHNRNLRIEDSTFSSFKLFFMLSYPHRSWCQLGFYGLLAIFLGCLGSVGATFLFEGKEHMSDGMWWWLIIGIMGGLLVVIWLLLKYWSRIKFK